LPIAVNKRYIGIFADSSWKRGRRKHPAKFADRPSATREISNLRGTPLLGDAVAEVVKIPAGVDADKYLGNHE